MSIFNLFVELSRQYWKIIVDFEQKDMPKNEIKLIAWLKDDVILFLVILWNCSFICQQAFSGTTFI